MMAHKLVYASLQKLIIIIIQVFTVHTLQYVYCHDTVAVWFDSHGVDGHSICHDDASYTSTLSILCRHALRDTASSCTVLIIKIDGMKFFIQLHRDANLCNNVCTIFTGDSVKKHHTYQDTCVE